MQDGNEVVHLEQFCGQGIRFGQRQMKLKGRCKSAGPESMSKISNSNEKSDERQATYRPRRAGSERYRVVNPNVKWVYSMNIWGLSSNCRVLSFVYTMLNKQVRQNKATTVLSFCHRELSLGVIMRGERVKYQRELFGASFPFVWTQQRSVLQPVTVFTGTLVKTYNDIITAITDVVREEIKEEAWLLLWCIDLLILFICRAVCKQ